ncbi:MAG: hypothetical protein M3Y35_05080 [Actinomycetota bacterium]|nr:hypothetical protein [Actinomycetota bacterium]
MRVLVVNHVSLDGVLQGPGRPDEDTRDGFRHGGWAARQANDPAMGTAIGQRMGQDFSWLFGRRSYDGMLAHWNQAGGRSRTASTTGVSTSPHRALSPSCPGRTPRC